MQTDSAFSAHVFTIVAAECILGGKLKYLRPSQRGAPAIFGGAPSKIHNIGAYINDYMVTPILHVSLPKREAPLVGNLGGQLHPLPILFRHP